MAEVLCGKCGATYKVAGATPTNKRCPSCRMKKASVISYGAEKCYPWHGDFDQDDNPMLDGQMFMPGTRLCKHKDCCNPQHIER